ncbi:DUF732 domain-containing protein [Mycobacterium sp. E3198]|uniref:DUF732 domain-containing protein n=1 Tax=Mycobacterium sp. E3198 TaxID=1834143 RepID=UPI0008004783|nr:DUF732 domain-containing protein [Mycobacterium sp. E3198]OBG26384.1 hypothetical protein A5673_08250 [Mycobacterium sp. E3198]
MFASRVTAALATALGTAAVGLAVATAGAAGATTFSANQDAVQAGHQVCSELAAGKSKTAVALMLTTQARMSPRQAGYFVAAATKFYCPQFDGQTT